MKGQTTATKENRKRKDLPLGNLRDCSKLKKTNKAQDSCINKFKKFSAACQLEDPETWSREDIDTELIGRCGNWLARVEQNGKPITSTNQCLGAVKTFFKENFLKIFSMSSVN